MHRKVMGSFEVFLDPLGTRFAITGVLFIAATAFILL